VQLRATYVPGVEIAQKAASSFSVLRMGKCKENAICSSGWLWPEMLHFCINEAGCAITDTAAAARASKVATVFMVAKLQTKTEGTTKQDFVILLHRSAEREQPVSNEDPRQPPRKVQNLADVSCQFDPKKHKATGPLLWIHYFYLQGCQAVALIHAQCSTSSVAQSVSMALSVYPQAASGHAISAGVKSVFLQHEQLYIHAAQSSLVVHSLTTSGIRYLCRVPLRPLDSDCLTIDSLVLLDEPLQSKSTPQSVAAHFCICGQTTKGAVAAAFSLSWLGADEMFAQIRVMSRYASSDTERKACPVNARLGVFAISRDQSIDLWRLPVGPSAPMVTKPQLTLQPCVGSEAVTALTATECGTLLFAASSSGNTHCYSVAHSSGSGKASYLCSLPPPSTGCAALCLAATSVPSPLPAHTDVPLHGTLASTALLAGLSSGETAVYWLGHALAECRLVAPLAGQPIDAEAAAAAASGATAADHVTVASTVPPLAVIACLHASQAAIAHVQWLRHAPIQLAAPTLTAAVQATGDCRWKLLCFDLKPLPSLGSAQRAGGVGSHAAALAAQSPAERTAAGWSHAYDDRGRLQWTPPPVPDNAALFDRYFDVPSPQQASTAAFVDLMGGHPPAQQEVAGEGPFLLAAKAICVQAASKQPQPSSSTPAAAAEEAAPKPGTLPAGLALLVTSSAGSYLCAGADV